MTVRDPKGKFAKRRPGQDKLTPDELEDSIQKTFHQYFAMMSGPRVLGFSVPNERVTKSGSEGFIAKLVSMGMLPGMADYVVAWDRGVVLLEFKSLTGRQQPNQKLVQASAQGAGIPYFIVRSWQEALAVLEAERVPMSYIWREGKMVLRAPAPGLPLIKEAS